jgi:hypothetical protein
MEQSENSTNQLTMTSKTKDQRRARHLRHHVKKQSHTSHLAMCLHQHVSLQMGMGTCH